MATPSELLDAAKCNIAGIDESLVWFAVLANLIDVGNGDPVPTDIDDLTAEAACLQSQVPPGLVPYLILQAVSGISGGGGGTGGAGAVGVGSPEGVVTAPPGTVYLDTATNSFYAKGIGVGNTGWVLLIS